MESDRPVVAVILDDSRSDARLIARWLSRSQAIGTVLTAHEAAAALEQLRSFGELAPYRLLLLDLNLRSMSGLEVLSDLRARPEFAPLKVVVVTGSVSAEDRRRAEAAGADLFLLKPGDVAEFAQFVEDLDAFCRSQWLDGRPS